MPYKDPEDKKRSDKLNYLKNREKYLIQFKKNYHKKWKFIPRYRVQTNFGKAEVKIPRIGVCNLCRAVAKIDCAYTHFAHFSYNYKDLSKNILELCPKCHKYMDGFIKDPITGRFKEVLLPSAGSD